jgi:hypothetical protein
MALSYATKGWCLVGLVVLAVDFLAPENDTLSEGIDRALDHPVGKIVVPIAVYHVADHLLNRLDPRFDLLHNLFGLLRLCRKAG